MSVILSERRENLKEISNRKVVEHNDLITGVAKMDKTPIKIFELAVSCIDTKNPPENNSVCLTKKTLFAFFDVTDTNKNFRFKKVIEEMQNQIFLINKKTSKGNTYERVVPIPSIKWSDFDDIVTFRFDESVMPYLLDLKDNFTQFALMDIMEMTSKYSIILYKWIMMKYNQFTHYEQGAKRTEQQLESYRNPVMEVAELRRLTDTLTQYKQFSDFEKRVLKPAIDEINEHTRFAITYDKIKKGRSVIAVKFYGARKEIPEPFYKQEQQDPAYTQAESLKKQQEVQDFIDLQQNPYTLALLNTQLIGVRDMTDIELMVTLYRKVYPLYDQLAEKVNRYEVERHLLYVKEKQQAYSKENIAKYLYKAISSYLKTI
ncbi:RepB family plasmid replication initiator protein [Kurthia sibirica]|uniref:RepB protein n=1 Tax=Kurthia sibirica TaxID=202750 RepID=A0A2U3AGQ7_9BACL|nr:RepB family plasmid replication initiator protein [Kurthia sibirica]PWI23733.1 RepB protein [Kurthia sibirica]GEK35569.1 hypothetical protein KSI01_31020 [Kurthia sibirica]